MSITRRGGYNPSRMDPKLPPGPSGPPGPAAALPSDVLLQEDVEVSEELRARILRQIDQVMVKGRQPLAEGTLAVKPRKKGVLFPVLTNVVTAMVVAAGIFGHGLRVPRRPGPRGPEQHGLSVRGRPAAGDVPAAVREPAAGPGVRDPAGPGAPARRGGQPGAAAAAARGGPAPGHGRRSWPANGRGSRRGAWPWRRWKRACAPWRRERQAALAAELGRLRAGLKLQELADARAEERLLTDRIRAGFAQALDRLRSQDVPGARACLASLRDAAGRSGDAGTRRVTRAPARGPAARGGPVRAARAARAAGSGRRPWRRASRPRRRHWPICARSWPAPRPRWPSATGRSRGCRRTCATARRPRTPRRRA